MKTKKLGSLNMTLIIKAEGTYGNHNIRERAETVKNSIEMFPEKCFEYLI